MGLRQRLGEVAVALVGDDDRAAGLGDQEIRARDADIGGEEFFAQHGARFAQQAGGLDQIAFRRQMGMDAAEFRLDLLLGEMHRGCDDVGWHLVAELDDVFAEVGLDRDDAVGFQVVVEPDLLGDHRLSLGGGAGAERLADAENDLVGIMCRDGVMHVPAGRRDLFFVGFEIEVEMGQRMVLDVARRVAQRVELGQLVRHLAPAGDEVHLDEFERVLQIAIGERRLGVLLEAWRGRDVGHGRGPVARRGGAPIAGSAVMPASTSATWRTSIALPSRCSLPAMFIRQPRSPAISMPAPLAATLAAFLATIAFEMSGYLTQKVPPKPQHTSGSRISVSVSPRTVPSSRRGWTRTPSSRNPEQESW